MVLGAQNGPKNSPLGLPLHHFCHPKSIRKSMSFFDVEKVVHGRQKVSFWVPETLIFALKNNTKTTFSKIQLFRSERPRRHQKSPNAPPKGSQNGPKSGAKIEKNGAKITFEYGGRFLSIFDGFWGPFWGSGSVPRTSIFGLFLLLGSKRSQDLPPRAPETPQTLILGDFWPPRTPKSMIFHAFEVP